MHPYSIIATVLIAPITYYIYSIYKAYRLALKIGLPIVIIPVDPHNPLWLISSVPLKPLLSRILPAFIWHRLEIITYGFEHESRWEPFARNGKAYTLVGPGSVQVWLADAELLTILYARRKSFEMQQLAALLLARFGPNVLSSTGNDWQRQRKLIAPAINEQISEAVWNESIDQARQMLASFGDESTNKSIQGLRTIAINVLGAAGYGKPRKFDREDKLEPGFQTTFMSAILTVIESLVLSGIMPPAILLLPFMPKSWRDIGVAVKEFPVHQKMLIESERASTTNANKTNLMSTLIRLSDQEWRADRDKSISSESNGAYLTEEELHGNLYLVTLAGFDTTANTMGYAMAHLALDEELQEWLFEEIRDVQKTVPTMEYTEAFQLLPRCLAFMYETLRLYCAVTHTTRDTLSDEILKTADGRELFFPKDLIVFICNAAVQINPEYWGTDAMSFRPSRWIGADGALKAPPVKGSFVPWGGGPRLCPGQKMAQVEFVAVFSTILKDYRVELVRKTGESLAQAKSRLMDVINDSQPKLTVSMNRPQDVLLRFVKR